MARIDQSIHSTTIKGCDKQETLPKALKDIMEKTQTAIKPNQNSYNKGAELYSYKF